MRSPFHQARLTVAVVLTLGPIGLVAAASAGVAHAAPATSGVQVNTAPSGPFTSLPPARLLDTRSGTGAPAAPVAPGATLTLTVEGQGNVAPSGVSAVVLNVTVTQPRNPGYITVYPDGSPKPLSSNLNFTPGETIPNLVIAPVGPDGKVDLYNGSAGTVQLVADVSGYFNTILSGVRTVVTNSNDACALLFSGGVDCWGYNVNGQTGSGAATEFSLMPLPVRGLGGTGTLGGVASVVTDGGGFCAVLTSGGLDCWGSNGDGDLGNGTTRDGPVPVAVNGVGGSGTLSGVTSVVGGGFSYCALLSTSGVDCWGNNFYGGLGTASSAGFSGVVGAVKGVGGTGALSGVASLVNDGTTVCAILASNGAVDCWGGQPISALGNGTDDTSDVPVAVEGVGGTGTLTGVARLSAQGETICAVLSSGGVDCWGEGSEGVLGAGPDVQWSTVPVAVEGAGGTGLLTGVSNVIGDGRSACALLTSGRVDCWGEDNEGQLGYGTIPLDGDSFVPAPVVGVGGTGTLSGVADLASNFSGFCASLAAGGVDCWGDNGGGQLGEGTISGPDTCDGQSCSTSPAPVINPDNTASLTGVADVVSNSTAEVGGYGYYAVLASGGVDCWGAGTNAEGVLGNDPFQDSSAYSVPTPV
jgi:alpha-tubulin suppressor-like RCC1 family protein